MPWQAVQLCVFSKALICAADAVGGGLTVLAVTVVANVPAAAVVLVAAVFIELGGVGRASCAKSILAGTAVIDVAIGVTLDIGIEVVIFEVIGSRLGAWVVSIPR